MAAIPLSQSPTIRSLELRLTDALTRIVALEQGNPVELPDIYNTLAGSTLPAGQIDGFMDLATDLDNRLIALGY